MNEARTHARRRRHRRLAARAEPLSGCRGLAGIHRDLHDLQLTLQRRRQQLVARAADMILKANDEGLLYEQGMTWHGEGPYPPDAPRHAMVPAVVGQEWPRYIREGLCPDNWFRPVKEAS